MRAKILVGLAALTLAVSSGVAPAAAAKKYTACVNKSTGEMRILLGKPKKCQKGWKKRTWTKAGPEGDRGAGGQTGPANSFGNVVDADGTPVGQLLGVLPSTYLVLFVRVGDGLYSYAPGGLLVPSGDLFYDNATCAGAPFAIADTVLERDALQQDSGLRYVERVTPPVIGLASAFAISGPAYTVSALPRWQHDTDGSCVATSDFTGYRLPLSPVAAPPDHRGPLRISQAS